MWMPWDILRTGARQSKAWSASPPFLLLLACRSIAELGTTGSDCGGEMGISTVSPPTEEVLKRILSRQAVAGRMQARRTAVRWLERAGKHPLRSRAEMSSLARGRPQSGYSPAGWADSGIDDYRSGGRPGPHGKGRPDDNAAG